MRPFPTPARALSSLAALAFAIVGTLLVVHNIVGTEPDAIVTNIGLTCLIISAIIAHGLVADSHNREEREREQRREDREVDRHSHVCQRLTRVEAVNGHMVTGLCEVGDRTRRISQLERLQYDLLREMNDGGTGPQRLHSI